MSGWNLTRGSHCTVDHAGNAMPAPSHLLARSLSDYAIAVQGRTPRVARVVLTFDDGESVEINLPERLMIVAGLEAPAAAMPVEQAIIVELEAIPPTHTLTGEDLAARIGYAYGGWFKRTLASLVSEGKIKSNGRRGYSKADAE